MKFIKLCRTFQSGLAVPEVSYDAQEVLRRLPEVRGIVKGEGERRFQKWFPVI